MKKSKQARTTKPVAVKDTALHVLTDIPTVKTRLEKAMRLLVLVEAAIPKHDELHNDYELSQALHQSLIEAVDELFWVANRPKIAKQPAPNSDQSDAMEGGAR
jgi:hypothetical protein